MGYFQYSFYEKELFSLKPFSITNTFCTVSDVQYVFPRFNLLLPTADVLHDERLGIMLQKLCHKFNMDF